MAHSSCSSSCGGCGGGCGGCETSSCAASALSDAEQALLMELAQTPFLPIGQFARRESYFSPHIPLEPSPIYLHEETEPTAVIELTSLTLRRLASRGFVTLDYDVPLSGYDYGVFKRSAILARLKQQYPLETVLLHAGSMALTAAGQQAIDDLSL